MVSKHDRLIAQNHQLTNSVKREREGALHCLGSHSRDVRGTVTYLIITAKMNGEELTVCTTILDGLSERRADSDKM